MLVLGLVEADKAAVAAGDVLVSFKLAEVVEDADRGVFTVSRIGEHAQRDHDRPRARAAMVRRSKGAGAVAGRDVDRRGASPPAAARPR